MSLNTRHWLAERHIELAQLKPSTAQIAGIAFRIAQDMEVKSLNPFAICSLADVLELPLSTAWQAAPTLAQLTLGLLRILNRKKLLRRNEGTWLTFQVAYLNALHRILEQEALAGRPWLNRAEIPSSQDPDEPIADPQLLALLKTLRPGRLSDSQAEQALSQMGDSFLVQQINNCLMAWFAANGVEETEAKLLTQRLSNGLPGHLLTVIAENALPLAQLQKFVRLGNLGSLRDTTTTQNTSVGSELSPPPLPLSLNREYYRAGLLLSLSDPLIGEPFALQDLYVPLKGKRLRFGSEDGQLEGLASTELAIREGASSSPVFANNQPPVDLMAWVMSQLDDTTSIAVIQAEAGEGKTSFCQMLASRVAQDLYPNWMPVIIPLGQVILGQTFEQTLDSAFKRGRFTDTDGWLSLNSPPCLLILDGLDQLPHSSYRSNPLRTFMEQVMSFHAQTMGATGQPRHKIVLTGRSATVEGVIRKYRQNSSLPLPTHLQRIVIQPMGQDEFRLWFQHWAKVQSKSIAQAYFTFLKHGGVFSQRPTTKDLASLLTRPLMLFLLGLLHRDAWVDESIFQLDSSQAKFEIYDRICRWLLGEPIAGSRPMPELSREGLAHATRSQEVIANLLKGRSPYELRHQMQVVALSILQSTRHPVPSAVIQTRLTSIPLKTLPSLFFRFQVRGQGDKETFLGQGDQETTGQGDNCATLPLSPPPHVFPAAFPTSPYLGFSHSCLGEYLCAEELAAQLQLLTRQVQNPYGDIDFLIPDAVGVAQHLYALLGYGLVSSDIEELIIERLCREEKRNAAVFSFPVLFERLQRFYQAYCRGQWLDAGIAHQAHSQLKVLHNPLNVLQVEAAVGLNVFLLLCSVAREAQVSFWPCGNPTIPQEFDADQLLSFINRTAVLSPTTFWQQARHSLSYLQLPEACLNQVMLAGANLAHTNLSTAELMGSNLAGANLQNANLSWANLATANLANANLSNARLEGADLSGANLKGANLKGANLTNACLFQAQLDEASQNFAQNSKAIFSWQEFQSYNQSLLPTKIIDNPEDDVLLEEEPTIFIESAEGEPMLPEVLYRDEGYDYEGETAQIEDIEQLRADWSENMYDAIADEETVRLPDFARDDAD